MKQTFSRYFFMVLLMSGIAAHADGVLSRVPWRSQSDDKPRRLVGTVPGTFATDLANMEDWYLSSYVGLAYSRTMGSSLGRALLGDSLQSIPGETSSSWFCNKACNSSQTIKIQGTDIENRDPMAWRANDFYLGHEFDGTLTFKPVISNIMVDLGLNIGFDRWVSGLYFNLYGPFVHTRWNLNVSETVNQITDAEGYFTNAQEFFSGAMPPVAPITYGPNPGTEVDIIQNPLKFHKMLGFKGESTGFCEKSCSTGLTKNGFGELRADLGWNFLLEDYYHFGIYLTAAAPTGNKVSAEYLFAPQIGNGQKWELGAGLAGHYLFWQSEDEESNVGIYGDVSVSHLFKSREHRVFDLANNGPMSRYMLAARMVSPTTNELRGSTEAGNGSTTAATDPNWQFGNEFMPVANLTAQDVNVSIGVKVDMTAWFNYTVGGFTADLGYNLWFQSCERMSCVEGCGPQLALDQNTWALVGDSWLTGVDTIPTQLKEYAIPFSQSRATLTTGSDDFQNEGVDNPQYASVNVAGTRSELHSSINNKQMFLSSPVQFLSASDINMEQRNSSISHSIFANLGYVVQREEGIEPYFGFGGKVEFGTNNKVGCDTVDTSCSTSGCTSFSVSQFEVFGKIGILFN